MQRYEDIKELVQDLEKIHEDLRVGVELDAMIEKISKALQLYGHFQKEFMSNTFEVNVVKSAQGELTLQKFDHHSLD